MRHLARFTEKQYIAWIRQFVLYHGKRHPRGMGEREIEEFLTYLAAQRNVAPATQNQALNAIVFLFRHVLGQKLGTFKNVTWAKRRMHIPVVLTRDETVAVLCAFRRGSHQKLIAHLLYGCGLRLTEALNLRIKDVDFGQGIIIVRDAKGGKDRTVPLPKLLERPLRRQIGHAKCVHAQDVREGYGRVSMPYALQRKYPNADSATQWQYVFPSVQRSRDPVSGDIKRHHLYDSIMEEALAKAVRQCGLDKRVTCHTFRHSYATHLLESGKDIRMIQTLLGHSDVKTTMIYTHVAKDRAPKCESPLDLLPLPPAEKQSEAESETEATLVAGEAPSETSQCSRDQHVSPGCGGVPGCSSGASTGLPPLLPQPGRADRAIEVGRWHRFTAWLRSTINRR